MVTWTTGDPLQGAPVAAGDVEFSVETQGGEEMVVVAEPKAKAVKGDFLLRHIARFEDIIRDLNAMKPVPQAPAPAPVAAQ